MRFVGATDPNLRLSHQRQHGKHWRRPSTGSLWTGAEGMRVVKKRAGSSGLVTGKSVAVSVAWSTGYVPSAPGESVKALRRLRRSGLPIWKIAPPPASRPISDRSRAGEVLGAGNTCSASTEGVTAQLQRVVELPYG